MKKLSIDTLTRDDFDETECDEVPSDKKGQRDNVALLVKENRELRNEVRRLNRELTRMSKVIADQDERHKESQESQYQEQYGKHATFKAKDKAKEDSEFMEFTLPDGTVRKIKKTVSTENDHRRPEDDRATKQDRRNRGR